MWMQTQNGKFHFIERYKDPLTNKYRTVSITMGKNTAHSRKVAQIELDKKIQKRISKIKETKNVVEGITLKQCIDEFMTVYRKRVRRSSYFNKQRVFNLVLDYFEGDSLVDQMTQKALINFLHDCLYNKKLSNSYVSKIRISLDQLFSFAGHQNYAHSNPAKDIELKYPNNEKSNTTRNKFLEADELKKLLNYAYQHNERYALLCEWLYQTGMRAGEAAALNFNDITQENGNWVAHVTGTLEYDHLKIKEEHKSDAPKTQAGFRDVVLSKRAVQLYQRCRELNSMSNYVFATGTGSPIQISSLNTFLRTAKKRLEIDKPLSSHIFRHTHISKLAELGVPLYIIQQRVGHSSSRITQQIYLHVTQKAEQKVLPKLDQL